MTGRVVGSGSWRELFSRRYRGAATVLAGGVAIYATNEFITMSLLPSAIDEIGGARLYAWVTTVYLVASVVGATTVGPVLTRSGRAVPISVRCWDSRPAVPRACWPRACRCC